MSNVEMRPHWRGSLAPVISAELPDRIIPTTSGVRDGPSMIASETVVVTAMRHELNTTSEMISRIMCAMLPNVRGQAGRAKRVQQATEQRTRPCLHRAC